MYRELLAIRMQCKSNKFSMTVREIIRNAKRVYLSRSGRHISDKLTEIVTLV